MKNLIYLLIFTVLSVLSFSCKKPFTYSNKNLSFSTDSLLFDTVFTTIGSTTKRFKLYNTDNVIINIEEMELMGGANSPFRINIDGTSGTVFKDVELAGGDSLFAFVEVTLAVNNVSNPLVISDSIRFKTNGKNQYVNLDVWGQDAYFHVNELVGDGELWLNDKPHVIYGFAAVGLPETETSPEVINQTLTIQEGSHKHGHKGALMFVYKSTLIVNGALGNEVVFEGDRLESFYDDISGQWRGIILRQAKNCIIDYAIIKNGGIGLQIDTTSGSSTLILNNSIIKNNDFYNLYMVAGPIVTVKNCLFGDAGIISAFSFVGGDITFTNCNFVNYWNGTRSGPSFGVKTWFKDNSNSIHEIDLKLKMYNSVMYGNALNELVVDSLANSSNLFDVTFENCLYKTENELSYTYIVNSIWNQNPLFVDTGLKNFKVQTGSPLIDAGSSTNFTIQSIDGMPRSNPDIGVYEF